MSATVQYDQGKHNNLGVPPLTTPLVDKDMKITSTWYKFFIVVYSRITQDTFAQNLQIFGPHL